MRTFVLLNANLATKANITKILTTEQQLSDLHLNNSVYTKLVDAGVLPNASSKTIALNLGSVLYAWIDPSNSYIFNASAGFTFPHVDPGTPKNSVTGRFTNGFQNLIVTTAANWTTYSAYVVIKYVKK